MTKLLLLCVMLTTGRCQTYKESFCNRVQEFHQSACLGPSLSPGLGVQGPPGKRGSPGEKGEIGVPGSVGKPGVVDYNQVESVISQQMKKEYLTIGSITNPASSCKEIKSNNESTDDGVYYLKDIEGNVFQTFCDMNTAGGGWTLVASIHENNMKGRCTTGDRWSSEQGNSAEHPHGDGFWENRATHGEATSAASDDYKNSGYFAMNANDIMIWQVPNDTPIGSLSASAFLKYHTNSGFLRSYGANLRSLYSNHFNMRAKQFRTNLDNGPAIPIIWDTGNNEELLRLLGVSVRGEVDAGFVQFRAINHERNAFALCPGVKIKAGKANVEHPCIGSTSYNIGHTNEEHYCGDFSAMDWPHYAGWKSAQKLIDSVVMIFYK